VPLATYTCDRDGTCVPFVMTRADGEAKRDPHASIAERYTEDADSYLLRVRGTEYAKLFGEKVAGDGGGK
jgi:hypothetical protein